MINWIRKKKGFKKKNWMLSLQILRSVGWTIKFITKISWVNKVVSWILNGKCFGKKIKLISHIYKRERDKSIIGALIGLICLVPNMWRYENSVLWEQALKW